MARALEIPMYQLFYQGEKPPKLPMQFTQAIPDAAAVPVRIIDGKVQNGPLVP